MKKLALLGLMSLGMLVNTSCLSDDDAGSNIQFVYLKTNTVSVDSIAPLGKTSVLDVTYTLPSSNYQFYTYELLRESGTKDTVDVAVVSSRNLDAVGDQTPKDETNKFRFNPSKEGNFVFRFWAGKDVNNKDIFLVQDVKIVR